MRLDQALVSKGLSKSRTEAQEIIISGGVLVNGQVTTKQTKQISETDAITVTQKRKFVSRGGLKLEGILFDIHKDEQSIRRVLNDKIALDIGSSTGGFTDCLLTYGIASVIAVDVGTAQLHTSLRNNPNITLFENTDIRDFSTDLIFNIIVADLSFIPLEKVFEKILSFGSATSEYYLLIKPQFEVGRGNTKKGIVKDAKLTEEILDIYKNKFFENGFKIIKILPCIISGRDGNQEFFLYAKK